MADQFEIEGEDALAKRLAAIGDTRKLLGTIGLRAVAIGKELVPRKTGNLGRTIRLGTVTESEVQIIAGGELGVGYAQSVEFGHREFFVAPRHKKALAWGGSRRLSGSLRTGSRATAFSRGHKIPASKGKPFLRPAAQKAVDEAGVESIVKAWNDAA